MNESCWICLACVPARRLLKLGFTAAPRCTGTEQSHGPFAAPSTLSAPTQSHTAPARTPVRKKARGRAHRAFSITKGGTQQLRKGPDATI